MRNHEQETSDFFSLKRVGGDGINFGYKLATVVVVKLAIWVQIGHFAFGQYSVMMHGIFIVSAGIALFLLRKLHPTVFVMCIIAMLMPNAVAWIATTEASAMIKHTVVNVSMITNLATVPLIVLNELFYSPEPVWWKRVKAQIARIFG